MLEGPHISLSTEEQNELATKITRFLSHYKFLSESYIIEFFTEDLWHKLPVSWQAVLQHLSYPQIAELLLNAEHEHRRYPCVWPLSLLAFRDTAHSLAFPRSFSKSRAGNGSRPEPREFQENQNQSSLLTHAFRKHVKPKKQHEIRELGTLVKQLCEQTKCNQIVDVGSGQGHLTRYLSFGLGLSVTAIEADPALVAMANRFDGELLWALEKERQKRQKFSCEAPSSEGCPRHVTGWVDPKASWEVFIQQLGADQANGDDPLTPCNTTSRCPEHLRLEATAPNPDARRDLVLTGLHACGDLSPTLLRHFIKCPHICAITSVACCYMKLTTKEQPAPPGVIGPPGSPQSDPQSLSWDFGYPMSEHVRGLPGHQLSYKAREAACHATEDYMARLREESTLLRTHCYRAALEVFITDTKPDLRRAGIQTVKKAHLLTFNEYARLGLARVGLPTSLPLDARRSEAMLAQQGRVVVFFSLALMLAPVVETLVLLDRVMYLRENGVRGQLFPLFDPNFSPRNFVLVAQKSNGL
ncbi:methyltransferase-like protein 25B [Corythoichthys intestinalis]|uniref:methyltransferase-like protein 25B n=1 Tax=Corythoichthys intestinalis TaxID=161448 RepID=UPI0025A520DD|nr:methyltransferase-like protein 25B [Corythoichthys intestinalis]XP_057691065.1 methyltransferase-like protein 25B [Corythoichthys intestinalis]XP_061789107.1 methyltransferase-like protein 25B [Nerophis lumbriciformis]XP_061812057.1 methyltransferase-like protein 25B [Nerophis lumbriciformis]